jgi:hypothetical protein
MHYTVEVLWAHYRHPPALPNNYDFAVPLCPAEVGTTSLFAFVFLRRALSYFLSFLSCLLLLPFSLVSSRPTSASCPSSVFSSPAYVHSRHAATSFCEASNPIQTSIPVRSTAIAAHRVCKQEVHNRNCKIDTQEGMAAPIT